MVNTSTTTTQSTPKTTTGNTTATKSTVTTQPSSKTTSQTVSQTQTQTQTVKKSEVNTAKIKREYDNYKILLRNSLGKKINFTNVIGDGECVISFRINSSGKLIERKFYKQSSNITLNEAVYSAVMSMPSYNPPPSGYKNETLYLKISFYNGNFSISLN